MRLWIPLTIALTTGSALYAGAFTLNSSDSTLAQLDFSGAYGSGDSLNGELMVNSSAGSGYLNVLDASGNWVVQNLPVGLLPQGVDSNGTITNRLNLPSGTVNGSSETLTANMSATPLATFNSSIASLNSDTPSTLNVADTTLAIGGTGTNDNEDGVSKPAGTVSFNVGGLTSLTLQTNHPNVEAGINQCAPAAVANSLAWLGLTDDLENIPGTFGSPDNSLVASLDGYMGREEASADCPDANKNPGPCGVWPLDGKLAYLNTIDNPNIIVNFQDATDNGVGDAGNNGTLTDGGYQAGDGSNDGSGIVAAWQGTPSFSFIQSELAAGEDVEIDIRFPCTDSNGNATTCRHYVEVTGAGTILGVQWISHVSDQDQGVDGGTDSTQFDFVTGANGLPGWGAGAEIDQVISESIVPEPGTMALLGLGLLVVAGGRKYLIR
jgi:PEP-CTERM motif